MKYILLLSVFIATTAQAASGIIYEGRLIKPDTLPLEAANVFLHIQIRSPGTENCLLYDEQHTINMTGSNGFFSVTIGSGTRVAAGVDGGFSLDRIFANRGTLTLPNCNIGTTYTPAAGDDRKIQLQFNDGSGWQTLPVMALGHAPQAIEASQVSGYKKDQLLRVADGSTATEFTAANFTALWDLITGSSSLYAKNDGTGFSPTASVSYNNQRIVSLADPTAAQDAATKNYTDTRVAGKAVDATAVSAVAGDGKVLVWNQTSNRFEAGTANDVTKLPLTGGTMAGHINLGSFSITNAGNMVLADQGSVFLGKFSNAQETTLLATPLNGSTDRGRTWYNTDTNMMRYWDGTAAQNVPSKAYVDSAVASAGGSSLPLAGGTMTGSINMGNNTITGVGAPLAASNAVNKSYADSNLLGSALSAPGGGQIGQSVRWNAAGTAWEYFTPFSAADLLYGDVVSALGFTPQADLGYTPVNKSGDTMTGLLVLSGDPSNAVGAATKQYVDAVSTAASGTYLRIDGTSALLSDWDINGAVAGGTRQITGLAAPTVNDSAANKAYVDGAISASQTSVQSYADGKLVSKDLAVPAAPQDGQSIRWNNTAGTWEYFNLPAGGGDALVGNPLSQFAATTSAQLAGVVSDETGTGNAVFSVSPLLNTPSLKGGFALNGSTGGGIFMQVAPTGASGSYTWPSSPPGSNQVLQSDSSGNLSWVTQGAGGTVSSVTSANTDISIANTTTTPVLTLNVGTGANQIVKLDGSGRLPAVDGSQVGSLSAANITSGTINESRLPTSVAKATFVPSGPENFKSLRWNNTSTQWDYYTPFVPPVGSAGEVLMTDGTSWYPAPLDNMEMKLVDGSAASPALTFSSDPDNGIFRPGANTIGFAVAGLEKMRIDAVGRIGIGTAAPNSKLHVVTNDQSTAGQVIGLNSLIDAGPVSPSSAIYSNLLSVSTSSSQNITGSLKGGVGEVLLNGTGTVSGARGIEGAVRQTSGTANSAVGVYASVSSTGGSISNAYGLYVDSFSGSISNAYGVYVASTASKNYFAGAVGIGSSFPAAQLEVRPSSAAQPVMILRAIASQTGNLLEARDPSSAIAVSVRPDGELHVDKGLKVGPGGTVTKKISNISLPVNCPSAGISSGQGFSCSESSFSAMFPNDGTRYVVNCSPQNDVSAVISSRIDNTGNVVIKGIATGALTMYSMGEIYCSVVAF